MPRLRLPPAFCHLLPRFILVATLLPAVGCNQPHGGLAQSDHDNAKNALESALTAWKDGQPAAKWTNVKAPIRFVDDDWLKGNTLVEFQILSLRANIDGCPEALVQLTVRKKGGAAETSEALYGIDIRTPQHIAIGRDPMH